VSVVTINSKPQRQPNKRGHFGPYGGRYVPETLMSALDDLDVAFRNAWRDQMFRQSLNRELADFAGRPTPLYEAVNLSDELGYHIFLKREDLLHTGAHKINNALGQVLLAQRLYKKRIVAETGAGQHGVAVATVCARFGLEAIVYMGAKDIERQAPNVSRMKLLGAEVIPVESGTQTLKDATSEAIRDWVTNVRTTFYLLGSVVGPHPYPLMVRQFQRVIGEETRRELRRRNIYASVLMACVGGGSNAIGFFYPFLRDDVRLYGVEAAGEGIATEHHAATLTAGKPGVLHGSYSYLLQNEDGQVSEAHSVSAGLDYPGVGPEHSFLRDTGRVKYVSVTDEEALQAARELCRYEGILPALEPAHALGYLRYLDKKEIGDGTVVVCLSGRGDKDLQAFIEE
jgi:tryptophan synthase beta chain